MSNVRMCSRSQCSGRDHLHVFFPLPAQVAYIVLELT
jgi:hypothetical protein